MANDSENCKYVVIGNGGGNKVKITNLVVIDVTPTLLVLRVCHPFVFLAQ